IKIEKRIPLDSGLGNADSNAALILRMLNKIEELGLSDNDLIDLGTGLGANVAFFIMGEAGIYNNLAGFTPSAIQPDSWIVTCYPNDERENKFSLKGHELQTGTG